MTLSDLASIASVISGGAVLVSLIYLSLQIRQSSKHTKALILQGRAERIVNHHLTIANSDLATAWIVENGGTATPQDLKRRQFLLQSMAYDFSWEDTFSQHEAGLLGEEQFADFRARIAIILRDTGLRRYFSERPISNTGPTKFHLFIGELLSQTNISSPTSVSNH